MARGEVLAEMVLQGEEKFTSGVDEAADQMESASRSAAVLGGALGRMGEQISDAIIPTSLLGSRLDETGDEAAEAGKRAAAASFGFAALRLSTSGVSVSLGLMTTVGTSTIAMLGGLAIAAGAVMIALAPIAIGAAAIASAFGLIIGTGILAWGKGFQKTLKNLKKELTPLVKEFGQQFVPFLKETLQLIPGLAKDILAAIGPMDGFLKSLRKLRNVAFRVLPKLIGFFFDLGRWALPLVTGLATFILNNFVPALQKITSTGKRVGKRFARLKGAATRFWNGLQPLLKELGPFVNELLRLGGIIAYVALTLGAKLLPLLAPVVNWITRGLRAVNNFAMSLGGVQSATNKLSPRLRKLKNETITLWKNIQPLIRTLMDVGKRVLPFVMGIVDLLANTLIDLGLVVLNLANGDFGEAKQVIVRLLGRLSSFAKKWGKRFAGFLRGAINGFIDWLKHDAAGALEDAAWAAGDAAASALKNAFNSVLPDSLPIPTVTIGRGVPGPDYTFGGGRLDIPQLDTGGFIERDGLAMLHSGERVVSAAQVDRGGGGGPEQIVVKLDAEATKEMLRGEAVDAFDERIADVQRKQQRRRGTR